MIHLIAFARFEKNGNFANRKQLAYDYIVKDNEIDKLLNKQRELFNSSKKEFKYLYTFHIRNHQGLNFKAIQVKDPYFENTELYKTFPAFLKALNAQAKKYDYNVGK